MVPSRLITPDDAPALAELLRSSREFLAPWEPIRAEDYFTVEGQRGDIDVSLDRHRQGGALPHVILDEDGRVVGRITLNGIVRGAFQSCSVGYWLAEAHTGRGLATAAVRHITTVAFEELGLHRVQAETLEHNVRSQRVLDRNGFVRYGLAPKYLKIAGRWQDCVMYQVLNPDADE
ncbi:MAG: GNAT family N-acetyltransferase [Actinomycetota bacterium]|nr:GNAT family N-acetyltransferase [Actinomycetota bacterium]